MTKPDRAESLWALWWNRADIASKSYPCSLDVVSKYCRLVHAQYLTLADYVLGRSGLDRNLAELNRCCPLSMGRKPTSAGFDTNWHAMGVRHHWAQQTDSMIKMLARPQERSPHLGVALAPCYIGSAGAARFVYRSALRVCAQRARLRRVRPSSLRGRTPKADGRAK